MRKTISLVLCFIFAFSCLSFAKAVNNYEADYTFKGYYDETSATFTIKMFYKSSFKTNLAAVGIIANTNLMTLSKITYSNGIDSLYTSQMGNDFKNADGIFVDAWFPSSGYIDAPNETLILTLTYNMSKTNYAKFIPATDFKFYNNGTTIISQMWNGTNYVFTPHEPSLVTTEKLIRFSDLIDDTNQTILYLGDVSLDGAVTSYDASLMLQYLAKQVSLSPNALICGNIDGKNLITPYDVSLVLQHIAKLPIDFEIGKPIK